jgi:hypothetical protein
MGATGTDDSGAAGALAPREYDRRRTRNESSARQGGGRTGTIAIALSGERQSTVAWKSGATGEAAEVGRVIDAISQEHLVVVHDRRTPEVAREH